MVFRGNSFATVFMIEMFFMTWFALFSGIMSLPEYDFEGGVPTEISSSSGSLQTSTDRFKTGSKSLKWQWTSSDTLIWDLSLKSIPVTNDAGIKFWIYSSNPSPSGCLSVCLEEKKVRAGGTKTKDSCFPISLNFKGWRTAWVAYRDFRRCPSPSSLSRSRFNPPTRYNGWNMNQLTFSAPSSATPSSPLFIDVLRFVDKVTRETRDWVVPPLSYTESGSGVKYCTSCAKVIPGLSEDEMIDDYKREAFWQQIYRWSLKPPTSSPAAVDPAKRDDLRLITRRLVNWYANESKAFTRIPHSVSSSDPFLVQRWHTLLKSIDRAHNEFTKFKAVSGSLVSGLFARNSKFGDSDTPGDHKKFSTLFFKVLLPLSLEYYIKSRDVEVDHTACLFATKYTCRSSKRPKNRDVIAITGKNGTLKALFESHYTPSGISSGPPMHSSCSAVSQLCFQHVKAAINEVNQQRKASILSLFDYVKEQGFNKGSALGSNDHGLLGMSGFFHSVFLMREELRSAGKLNDIIDTMKWFAEFGEIYSGSFEFNGTTSDRIRTLMLFRLMTVLVMPDGVDKIRDMDKLKLWIDSILTINEGLGGFIKPDFTTFHHKTFYASAYAPPALHTAALISYLLQETSYEFNSKIRKNLLNALKVLRIVAVRYSTPSAVGGRFPNYTKAILAEHVPAYAYMAARPAPRPLPPGSSPLGDISLNTYLAEVRMFRRLYNPTAGTCTGQLNEHLCSGKVTRIYYLNTLGSVDILEKVKALALEGPDEWGYEAEPSPEGHWCKQFAALSIHRRGDWAVTVKGFDKFVWDFESSDEENRYAMYASHGAMLIANSESALSSKNVNSGWDWRKIPGTTVISTSFVNMEMGGARHYSNSGESMASGVTLGGSTPAPEGIIGMNGVFGMAFVKPSYESSYFSSVTFNFKKSVFFYDDIIVALGSNIGYTATRGRDEVHTTLFQDQMRVTPPKPDTTDVFRCNDGSELEKTSWDSSELVKLVDVNGNRYYIPYPDDQGLVLKRNKNQDSYNSTGTRDSSSGTYCTAWLNHGRDPAVSSGKDRYNYTVQVEAEPDGGTEKPFLDLSSDFTVLKQDDVAHVVKFPRTDERGDIYGYVVFSVSATPVNLGTPGPVMGTSGQSIIMVEEKSGPDKLYMSVTSPQLKLREKDGSPAWCRGGTTSPSVSDDVNETLLFCSKSESQEIRVNLRRTWSRLTSLYVGGKNKFDDRDHFLEQGSPPTQNLNFINLRNGADTEISYEGHSLEENSI